MPRVPEGYKSYTMTVRPAVYERLAALARSLGRKVTDELEHAITRHCDAPPYLTTPALEGQPPPARPSRRAAPEEETPPIPQETPASGPARTPAYLAALARQEARTAMGGQS
jgi:hypothetical protein